MMFFYLANSLEERRERGRGGDFLHLWRRQEKERKKKKKALSLFPSSSLSCQSFLPPFFTFFLQPRVLFRGRKKEMGKLLTPFSLSLRGERTEKPAELRGKVTNTFMGRGRKPCCIIHVLPTHTKREQKTVVQK